MEQMQTLKSPWDLCEGEEITILKATCGQLGRNCDLSPFSGATFEERKIIQWEVMWERLLTPQPQAMIIQSNQV